MAQFTGGENFVDSVGAGSIVNAARLNNQVAGATALNGLVLDQTEKVITLDADFVLLGDSTLATTFPPKKVQIQNLQSEAVRNGSKQFAIGTLTGGTTYSVPLPIAATAYTAGMVVRFRASAACGAAPLIQVNALAALPIVTGAGVALIANDILAGQQVTVLYDAVSTNFQLVGSVVTGNMLSGPAQASAQQYAVATGTSSAYVLTLASAPAAYLAGQVVRFKANNTNTLSGGHTTLNLNSIGALNIMGANGADISAGEIISGQVVTLVYEAVAGTWIIQPRISRFISGLKPLTGFGSIITFAHGLGRPPMRLRVVMVQTTGTPDVGWAQNDEVDITGFQTQVSPLEPAFIVGSDSTNITVIQQITANLIYTNNKSVANTQTAITNASWSLKVYAEI